jgi:hypothetical protein
MWVLVFRNLALIFKKTLFENFSLFRCIYIISLLFETLSVTEMFALWLKSIVLLWGFFLFFNSLFTSPEKFKIKYIWLVIPFLGIGVLTSFANMSVDFLTNLIFVFNNSICFFVFFGIKKNTQKKDILHEVNFIFKFIILFSLVVSFLSLMTLFFKFKFNDFVFGIFKNRFFGIYANPNLAGFLSVISVFVCDYMLDSVSLRSRRSIFIKFLKKIIPKKIINNRVFSFLYKYLYKLILRIKNDRLILKICIILNLLVLFLSDSNASFVFINIYIIVKIFYNSFSKYESVKDTKILREILFLLVCAVMTISGSVVMRVVSQKAVNFVINNHSKGSVKKTPDNQVITEEVIDSIDNFDPKISAERKIGRENYDISSGRIYLFKQGVELFKVRPFIGIGRANLVRYGRIYLDGGLIFSDLHNSYLTILVSYGIIGFLFFLAFFVCVMKDMCIELLRFNSDNNSKNFYKFFSFLISYISYAVFEKAIFSEITFMAVFFWMILGYAISAFAQSD